ncbi:MAG: vitamin B12 dependent-methionine synthase activation domain-containing protein [Oscillospiraceae bacterium]
MRDTDYVIERSEVLRYLAYSGQKIEPELDKRIDEMMKSCLRHSDPKYCYEVFDIEETAEGIELIGCGVTFKGEDIRRHLHGAVSCAVMAVTIGLAAEREIFRLECQSVSDALIFNAACTAMVEVAADRCDDEIKALAASKGLYTNFRYSPGYGDFPLTQQPEVLGLINAGTRLGITLTDSLMMLPRKSVSAVKGMFTRSEQAVISASCESCYSFDTCEFRKRGDICGK